MLREASKKQYRLRYLISYNLKDFNVFPVLSTSFDIQLILILILGTSMTVEVNAPVIARELPLPSEAITAYTAMALRIGRANRACGLHRRFPTVGGTSPAPKPSAHQEIHSVKARASTMFPTSETVSIEVKRTEITGITTGPVTILRIRGHPEMRGILTSVASFRRPHLVTKKTI